MGGGGGGGELFCVPGDIVVVEGPVAKARVVHYLCLGRGDVAVD